MNEEWVYFKEVVASCAQDTCVVKGMEKSKRRSSEWWSEEIRELMLKERETHGGLLPNRPQNIKHKCRGDNYDVKKAKKKKKEKNERR